MQFTSFSFNPGAGWSVPAFPPLDSEQSVVMAFCATAYVDTPGPLADLLEAYPRACVLGCSTAGEIAGSLVNDASLSVAVVRFDASRVTQVSTAMHDAADSRAAGERLAQALDRPDLRAVFVLSDGLRVNASALVDGLNGALPAGVVVTGGLAADGQRFARTWVIRERRLESGVIAATGFYGERLRVGHGSRGGWDSFGPERRITRCAGNVLYELDGKPALALYKQYLGERAAGLPATGMLFPLSIRADREDARQLVRTLLAVDEAEQSMTFAGDMPLGYLAQLMKASFDGLVHGAGEAAERARGATACAPVLAVAVSCVGRRLVLGERIEEETEATLETLPPGSAQVGFYSYGEISPYAAGRCDLHNQTMTLTTFAED